MVADAKRAGYQALLTNDKSQLTDPDLCAAIKKSGLHHIRYDQAPGTIGLALSLAAIIAVMLRVMEDLVLAKRQLLVKINPPYWPR